MNKAVFPWMQWAVPLTIAAIMVALTAGYEHNRIESLDKRVVIMEANLGNVDDTQAVMLQTLTNEQFQLERLIIESLTRMEERQKTIIIRLDANDTRLTRLEEQVMYRADE